MKDRLRRLLLCRLRKRHEWTTVGHLVERTKAVLEPSPDDEEGPPWSVGDEVNVWPIRECQRCGVGGWRVVTTDNPAAPLLQDVEGA